MCLLALAWNVHPRWRLLMAGNRDEAHARPTSPLARWTDHPGVLAGRDLRSGGTWAGLDHDGRMAVVTNVRDPRIVLPQAPSRGALAADFLGGGETAASYGQDVQANAPAYAPFNLILADGQDAIFLSNYPLARQVRLQPGVYGLSNGDLDEPWPKTVRLRQVLSDWVTRQESEPDSLWQALADEHLAEDQNLPDTGIGLDRERLLSAAFIRNPIYGTRASTVIALDYEGRGWISERRFDQEGKLQGETTLANHD
ncbi:NRDE family protein [Pseudoxanthomonas indica]|uniref:Uncharacterized conserved protein, contains NRDE domain n=1 Tax=Pseudoxanthomonas indica TaxID=428993 RepID=A0A1T5LGG4_9GAMM|nr:NRDE family protein [Pseudoxanthomonas indica]GGD34713.1 hypothetical protein GCM10007235_03320 [Pseudoxanthomonas indica]SKC74924.1 Uncharacterized conserved protein, contains NRDE domain [Pseudoxanthomonas indica]